MWLRTLCSGQTCLLQRNWFVAATAHHDLCSAAVQHQLRAFGDSKWHWTYWTEDTHGKRYTYSIIFISSYIHIHTKTPNTFKNKGVDLECFRTQGVVSNPSNWRGIGFSSLPWSCDRVCRGWDSTRINPLFWSEQKLFVSLPIFSLNPCSNPN